MMVSRITFQLYHITDYGSTQLIHVTWDVMIIINLHVCIRHFSNNKRVILDVQLSLIINPCIAVSYTVGLNKSG